MQIILSESSCILYDASWENFFEYQDILFLVSISFILITILMIVF